MTAERRGLYAVLISIHGLVRGHDMELGRDADTGGQVLYVVELARALAADPSVERVDLMTRLVVDPKVSDDYARPHEQIAERASIVRIPFGPRRYLRKEVLWPWLDCFVDLAIQHVREIGRVPDVVHGHYADAGLVGARLAWLLGAPFVFTGHSLGHEKRRRLGESGMDADTIESRYNMSQRIEAEESALAGAALVIASTKQEAEEQYAAYDSSRKNRVRVIPPGVDLSRFGPPRRDDPLPAIARQVDRFLEQPRKPLLLALSRADERKNLRTLIEAFAGNEELRSRANLAVVAGNRDDITKMDAGPRRVLSELLLLVDCHDLYGSVAYPKHHEPEDVPGLYRLAARRRGVFVNSAFTEPFGLTLIEAAASGLPMVATNDGGPRDILRQCRNGVLVDPMDASAIGDALLGAISDRARWRRWSRNGVRSVHRHYTWERHVDRYLKELEKIVTRDTTRPVPAVKSRLPTVDRLLVCDIDDTLLGDREGLAELLECLGEDGSHVAFAVATGRRLRSAVEVLEEWSVPPPEVFITAVGSEIHYGADLTADEDWARRLDYRWKADGVREALADIPGLRPQPKSEQRRYKVSYFVDEGRTPDLGDIRHRLRARGLQANVVYSHGVNLDLLPIRASKGLAVRHLADRWGIPIERVLVAGDSGNDEEMLKGKTLGVVVGNYSSELESLKGMRRVYFAEAPYARGVLEGIGHYEFLGEIRQPD